MPTSSQALILKNTDGPLHAAFGGRPHWRPAESWMDLFRRNDASRNSFLFSKHPNRKNPPPRKAETAPNLRLDFATLPEILKISGIRGSFIYNAFECSTQMPNIRRIHGSYDHTNHYPAVTNKDTLWSRHSVPNNFSDNAFEWTGHTTGYRALTNKETDWSRNSGPNNVNDKDFESSGRTSNYRTLRTKGTDWSRYSVPNNISDSNRAWTNTGGRNEPVYFIPQYRKVVQFNAKEIAQQEPLLYHTKTHRKGHEFIKLEDRDGHTELIKASIQDAHYFRLQHIEGTEEGTFRLIQSEPNVTGSFRLQRTGPQDVGDYRLVPADGYESDDFRLVTLDPKLSSFRLLQADPVDNRQYHVVTTAGEKNGQFRLIQAAQVAHRAWTNTPGTNETVDFIPQYRKTVKPCAEEFALHHSNSRGKMHELIKMEKREGHMELVKVPVKEAHYFRLQHIEGTEEGTFRLIRSEPNAAGSFRLECTGPQDVGDYHLVPADGYESDDFRLVTLDPKTSSFRLLQADPVDNRQYHVVTTAGEKNGQFRLIEPAKREADSHYYHRVDQFSDADSTMNYRLQSRDTREAVSKATTPYKSVKNTNLYTHTPPTRLSEDRYDYFKDVLPQIDTDREELSPSFLPDITLYDSNNLTGGQNQKHSLNTQHSNDTKQSNLLSYDNEMDEFRQKYMDSYRDASPEVYNRLVSLGFKPARTDKEHRQMKNIQPVNAAIETPLRTTVNTTLQQGLETRKPEARSNYPGVEWRTQNFENWTRTANTGGGDFYNFARSNFLPNEVMLMMSNSDRKSSVNSRKPSINDRKLSLIDEAKLKANYKAWKKKKITAVRMRKDLPPKDPNAVCVSLRDNAMPHGRLKELVEKNTGHSLIGLQFDPVSVHSIDNDAKSQWILRFEDPAVCERLVDYGLPIEGDLVSVRKYDDVMKEEHEAYHYYMILNEWRRRQQQKIIENERRPKARQKKKLTSSHTQTAGAT